MTTGIVAPPRPAAVSAVLARSKEWISARRKSDGKPFFFVPGSAGAVYMTAIDGCTCPAAQHSLTGDCKHQAAVRQHQQPAIREVRGRFETLLPACPCGDIADSRDGFCDRCASDREWSQRMQRRGRELGIAE